MPSVYSTGVRGNIALVLKQFQPDDPDDDQSDQYQPDGRQAFVEKQAADKHRADGADTGPDGVSRTERHGLHRLLKAGKACNDQHREDDIQRYAAGCLQQQAQRCREADFERSGKQ